MGKQKIKDDANQVDIHSDFRTSGAMITEKAIQVWEKLQLDIKHWQRELRIDDVDIELRWLAWDEYPNDFAHYEDHTLVHLFKIGFRQPHHKQSFSSTREFNSDYEVCLVHELLHIRNSKWYQGEIVELLEEGASRCLYEVSLDATAEALVRARRGITR